MAINLGGVLSREGVGALEKGTESVVQYLPAVGVTDDTVDGGAVGVVGEGLASHGEEHPGYDGYGLIARQTDHRHASLTEGGTDGGYGIERGYRHVKYLPLLFGDHSSSEVTSGASAVSAS